jgi:hypothetical protein
MAFSIRPFRFTEVRGTRLDHRKVGSSTSNGPTNPEFGPHSWAMIGCVPHVQRRDHSDGMELPEITRLSNDVDVDVDVEKRPFDATTASTTAFRPSTSLGMWDTPR